MDIRYYLRPNYGFDTDDEYAASYAKGVAKFILQPEVCSDKFDYFMRVLSPHMKSVNPKDINAISSPEYLSRVTEMLHNTPFCMVAVVKNKNKDDIVVGYIHLKFIGIPDEAANKMNVVLGSPDLNSGVDLGMVVDPKYYRLGIGKNLMMGAIEEFVKMHKDRVENFKITWPDAVGVTDVKLIDLRASHGIYDDPTIYLTVKKNNIAAINLYEKFEFTITNEDEINYQMKRTFK